MAFADAITNPPVKKYRTVLTKLLDALPGEEADALDLMLQNEDRYGHTFVSNAIKAEGPNHPDLDQNLFTISDKTVARWREAAFRQVNGL